MQVWLEKWYGKISRSISKPMENLDPERQFIILELLSESELKAMKPQLLEWAASDNEALARKALKMLGHLGDEEAVYPWTDIYPEAKVAYSLIKNRDNLYELLYYPDEEIREAALQVALERPEPRLIPVLLHLYQTHQKYRPTIRNIFFHLPSTCSDKLIDLFLTGDYPLPIKTFLLRAIGKTGGQRAFSVILDVIDKRDSQTLFITAVEIIRHVEVSEMDKLDKTLERFYEDLFLLKQAPTLNANSLLNETFRYYINVYLILLSIRYQNRAIRDAASWESLENILPQSDFLKIKTLLTPQEQKEVDHQEWDNLLLRDPWIRSIIYSGFIQGK